MDGTELRHGLFYLLVPVGLVIFVGLSVCFLIRDYLCPHCGAENSSKRGNCPDCGHPMVPDKPVVESAAAVPRKPPVPWLAWPIVLTVVAALALCQFGPQRYDGAADHYELYRGWPVACHFQYNFPSRRAAMEGRVEFRRGVRLRVAGLVFDVAVSLLIAASTISVCEAMLRRPTGARLRWRVAVAVLAMMVAALLAAAVVAESGVTRFPYLWQGRVPTVIQSPTAAWCPWYVRLPLLFGVGCGVYTGCRLVVVGLCQVAQKPWRKPAAVSGPLAPAS